jgi:hypothetical protein
MLTMAAVAQPKDYIERNPRVSLDFKFLSSVHAFRNFPRFIDKTASTHPEVNVHVPVITPLSAHRAHLPFTGSDLHRSGTNQPTMFCFQFGTFP